MQSNQLISYNKATPKVSPRCFIANNATIIGNTTIGDKSSIWFGCVIRGDVAKISIGNNTNIQDNTVIHVSRNGGDTIIGNNVTIGHKALLHGCTLHDTCFVGMGSIILDNATIETGGMLAAGSLLTSNKTIKSGELWAGSPAKLFRLLTPSEISYIMTSANNYYALSLEYKNL